MENIKKRPGRPKKNAVEKSKIEGIVAAPTNAGSLFEMDINETERVKIIIDALKKINESVYFYITPTHCYFLAISGDTTRTCLIKITGAKVHRFYCREEKLAYKFSLTHIAKILTSKKTMHSFIYFNINQSNKYILELCFKMNQGQEKWIINLEDADNIDLSIYKQQIKDAANYPLSFCLDWKSLKEYYNSWKLIDNGNLMIQKIMNEPLKFSIYGNITSDIIFDEKKINIVCKNEDIISLSIPINSLAGIVSVYSISQNLYFFVDDKKNLILSSVIDNNEKNGTSFGFISYILKINL